MSILDIVTTPTYSTTIPSSKAKVSYRPFLVGEEKSLLAAYESEDITTMINTVCAVVRSCITPKSATEKLTAFDVEYLFVQIRMKSIGEDSSIEITCPTCSAQTGITIQLDRVEVYTPPEHKTTVKLSDTLALKMKHPSLEEMTALVVDGDSGDTKMKCVALCIETVFDGEQQYHAAEETQETMLKLVKKFTSTQYNKLAAFFDTMPETRLTFDWKCPKCGTDHTKTLRGLNNFF